MGLLQSFGPVIACRESAKNTWPTRPSWQTWQRSKEQTFSPPDERLDIDPNITSGSPARSAVLDERLAPRQTSLKSALPSA